MQKQLLKTITINKSLEHTSNAILGANNLHKNNILSF